MLTPLKDEIATTPDIAHEARRFRTILRNFERNLELLFEGSALAPHVDHAALALAFSNWRERFDATKHLANINRPDFVIYAAGLMLKELLDAAPLSTAPRHGAKPELSGALASHPLNSWPEGYAYTSFCLSVAGAILHDMGAVEPVPSKASDDPKFWASFRENVAENPAAAVAFFDLVCGKTPNWDAPDVPWLRKAFAGAGLIAGITPASVPGPRSAA